MPVSKETGFCCLNQNRCPFTVVLEHKKRGTPFTEKFVVILWTCNIM
jgi:hypothetical protein